jgi:hypothetical protein
MPISYCFFSSLKVPAQPLWVSSVALAVSSILLLFFALILPIFSLIRRLSGSSLLGIPIYPAFSSFSLFSHLNILNECPLVTNSFLHFFSAVTPNKALAAPKSGLVEVGLAGIPTNDVCAPPVRLEDITVEDVVWAENAMATELLTELELFGALVEGQHSKVGKTKKTKFVKSSSSSSLPAHKRQGKEKKAAVHDSNKKNRQQSRKKSAAAKHAYNEDHLGDVCTDFGEPPVSPARKVAGRRVANVKKRKSFIPDELVDHFFDKCTPVVPALPSLDAIVCDDNVFDALLTVVEEPALVADSDTAEDEDTELLAELELFGARVEGQLTKASKTKKKFSKSSSSSASSFLSRKRQEKEHKVAVQNSDKKTRQQQRKKAAAAKYAYIEENLGDMCCTFEEPFVASSPVVVARAPYTRPQKVVADDLISFDECVAVVPALPSLAPIVISDNKFDVLHVEEPVFSFPVTEVELVGAPAEGNLLKRAVRVIKKLVAKAAKFVKSAFKAARNMVSC